MSREYHCILCGRRVSVRRYSWAYVCDDCGVVHAGRSSLIPYDRYCRATDQPHDEPEPIAGSLVLRDHTPTIRDPREFAVLGE